MRALLLVVAACLAACGGARDARTVVLALNWFPESEHGGYFAADAGGLYAARGLTVEIRPGGPGVPVVPRVASGEVDFGVVNADDVVAARAAGAPVVTLLAPIHRYPVCIMVHAESGIEHLADLRDVTLAMSPGTPYGTWIERHAALTNVTRVPYTGNVAAFLADPKLAQQAYVFSEPIIAAKKGASVRCLPVAEIGFDPYSSVLITRDTLVRDHPEVARAMTEASAIGWKQYATDPAPAHLRILERNPEIGREALDAGASALRPLVMDDDAKQNGVGSMTRERWTRLVAQMEEIGAIKDPLAPDTLYTDQFVPKPGA